MKTLRSTLGMLLIMFSTVTASAVRMSYYEMRDNARFLTDRMIYVLNLRPELIDDLYCINFDYICGVNDYLDDVARGYRYNEYRDVLLLRDRALISLLTEVEWRMLTGYDYFYRPITFVNNVWSFSVYAFDKWNRRLFFDRPRHFDDYRGGRYFDRHSTSNFVGVDRGHEMVGMHVESRGGRAMENRDRKGDMNRRGDVRVGNDNLNRNSNTSNNSRGTFTASNTGRTGGGMTSSTGSVNRSNVSSNRTGGTRSNVSRSGGGRR